MYDDKWKKLRTNTKYNKSKAINQVRIGYKHKNYLKLK